MLVQFPSVCLLLVFVTDRQMENYRGRHGWWTNSQCDRRNHGHTEQIRLKVYRLTKITKLFRVGLNHTLQLNVCIATDVGLLLVCTSMDQFDFHDVVDLTKIISIRQKNAKTRSISQQSTSEPLSKPDLLPKISKRRERWDENDVFNILL